MRFGQTRRLSLRCVGCVGIRFQNLGCGPARLFIRKPDINWPECYKTCYNSCQSQFGSERHRISSWRGRYRRGYHCLVGFFLSFLHDENFKYLQEGSQNQLTRSSSLLPFRRPRVPPQVHFTFFLVLHHLSEPFRRRLWVLT